jgi:hypothetical protein
VQRRLRVDAKLLLRREHLARRDVVDPVDDPAHRAVGIVMPHENHRLREVRVDEGRGGDEQVGRAQGFHG